MRLLKKFLEWGAVLTVLMLFTGGTQALSRGITAAGHALRAAEEWVTSIHSGQARELETRIGTLDADVRQAQRRYESLGTPESQREWQDLESLVLALRLERVGLLGDQIRRQQESQRLVEEIRGRLGYHPRPPRSAAEIATIAEMAKWLDRLDEEGRRQLLSELTRGEAAQSGQ